MLEGEYERNIRGPSKLVGSGKLLFHSVLRMPHETTLSPSILLLARAAENACLVMIHSMERGHVADAYDLGRKPPHCIFCYCQLHSPFTTFTRPFPEISARDCKNSS
jgi:hypothetical protein